MDPKQSRNYCCPNDGESVSDHNGNLTLISALGFSPSVGVTVRSSPEARGSVEIKASGGAVTPPPGSENDDIDGCDVQVEVATPDEDLPAAEGGVA
jgi:hypothetical protein